MAGRRRPARGLAASLAIALLAAGCRSPSSQADRYEAQFDQLVAARNFPAALGAIQAAVAKDESEPRRWIKLGEVQIAMGQAPGALDAFQHALDLQPDNLEALQALAVIAARGQRFDLAKRYVDPLLLIQPNNPAGLLASGLIAMHEKRFADAIAISNTLNTADPNQMQGLLLRAQALDAMDRTRDAVALLEARAKTNPREVEPLQLLMLLYQRLGDRGGIQQTAIRLMPLVPQDPRYALESARAYHAQGRDDLANAAIDAVRRSFAASASAMNAVADYWRATLPPAQAHARIVALAAGARPAVKGALATQLIELGDAGGAVALLQPFAPDTITSGNVDLEGRYARALFAAGRKAEAEAKANALLAFDPSNPDGLLLRARFALARRAYGDAVTDAQLVARDDPGNEEAALLVPEIYAAEGQALLAAGAFGDARGQFPDSAAVVRAQARWLLAQGRPADALDNAGSFAHAHSRRADAWAIYAETCAAAGDAKCSAEARAALARAP